jgi:hypothetical protein
MQLSEIVNTIPNLSAWSHAEKIKFFAWYLHYWKNLERFDQANLRACYDELHLEKPSNVSPYIKQLQDRKPKEVISDKHGYYLEKRVRDQLQAKYGQRPSTVQVDKLLLELPSKVPNVLEKVFLEEALVCFRHGAFRAAIVMCWNLAFDHLSDYVLAKHLSTFNAQLPITFPKSKISSISTKANLSELKESEFLQVCKSASIICGNLHKILIEKLNRRNIAAHPSSVIITQIQAEDFITDLINNVVLKLV